MLNRIKTTFLLLVLTQALHSIEEWIGRLWDVYPPAKFISGLISKEPRTGFLVLNVALFVFGLCSWHFSVRRNQLVTQGIFWFLIVMEIINGIGHTIWAVTELNYVPGVATAPVLFILAVSLAGQLLRYNRSLLPNVDDHG
jgi:hypothetical protein